MLIYIDEALLFSNFPDARPKKWRNEMRHNHRPLIIIIMNIFLAFNMFHANILEDSAFSCTILSSALMVILICIYIPTSFQLNVGAGIRPLYVYLCNYIITITMHLPITIR